jgi:hypothetical protein
MAVSTANVSHDTQSVDPDSREGKSRVEPPPPQELLISPELALVDPELAAIARALLPDVPPAIRAAWPVPGHAANATAAEPRTLIARDDATPMPTPGPATAGGVPRRRRAAMVAALPLAFAAGALMPAAIHRLDPHWARASQAVEPAPNPVVTSAIAAGKATRRTQQHTRRRQPTGLPAQPRTRTLKHHGRVVARRAEARVRLAANVLGVVVTPTGQGVRLAWRAPRASARVIVVRYRGQRRAGGTVVYRGRRSSYTDSRVTPGTYAYVIKNYDGRGRGSSGVTSVVVVK